MKLGKFICIFAISLCAFLLLPQKGIAGRVVVIDPGHGGGSNPNEEGYNLEIAENLGKYLEQNYGVEIVYTRTRSDNRNPKLRERGNTVRDIINEDKDKDGVPDNEVYFISIHNNAGEGTGSETWYYYLPGGTPTDAGIARDVQNELVRSISTIDKDWKDRGIKNGKGSDREKWMGMLRNLIGDTAYNVNPYPAMEYNKVCLTEVAFYDNPHDRSLLDNPEFIRVAGEDIAKGAAYSIGHPIITAYDKTGINPCHIDGEKVAAYLDFNVSDSNGIKEVKIDDKVLELTGTPTEASYTAEIIGEGDHYITVTDIDSVTHTSRLKVGLILQAEDCQFVIGNDHPDETQSVSTYVPETEEVKSYANPVVVMMWGSAGDAYRMIRSIAKEETLGFLLDFDPVLLARDHPLFVIPSGGLYGLDSSSTFRQNLATYVQNGGTLICFTQQHGYEFSALPDGEVSGYGWNEDQSCHTNAAYIDTYHPMFAGQDSANLDAYIDGYFTTWPDNATILLRRTKNSMPAMIAYPYGDGWVVVSSLYSDWSYGHGGITQDEAALIRDLISWAKNPDREIKEYKPRETVNITIPVTNQSNSPSNSVVLTLLDPNRNLVDTTEVVHSLNPGESTEIPFICTASFPLGIWWVNYALKDSSGNTIQEETEGERFQVSYHYVGYKSSNITFSITSDFEQYVYGSDATFTFHIWNQGENDQDITVWYSFPHNYWDTRDPIYGSPGTPSPGHISNLYQTINVPAHGKGSFVYTIPVHSSYDRLWADFYDENDNYLGKASRGFYGIVPSVDLNVTTDEKIYHTGEKIYIEIGLKNRQNVDYNVELRIIVTDVENIKIFDEVREVNLTAGGSVSETASLVLSTDSAKGIYVVRVEASRNGEIIGSGSTYFEVPRPILTVTPTIPDTFSLSSPNGVSFLIKNVGLGDLSDGKLEVLLEDPERNGVWSETREFALPAGQSSNFDFLISLSEVKFGDYRLINRVTTEDGLVDSGSVAIPCSVTTQASFDKLLYKTREPLSLSLEVTNTGKFEEPLGIILNIPTCNFTQSQKVTLLPNQSTSIPYSLTIPNTAPAGTNSAEVSLKMANTFTRTFNFAIQSSKLVLSLDKLEYAVGESGEIRIENQGGIDTDYDYTIKIVDLKGVEVSEQSGTGSIQWGTSQTIGFSLASSQILDGEYLLSCLVNEEKLNKKTLFERYIKVTGLAASLVASTDKKTYFEDEIIGASARITPSGGTISDGSLNLKIYSPEEKWAEYPDLKGTTYIIVEDGSVWFGTVSGKLIKYDKAKGDSATFSLPSDGIYGNYVYCLAVDENYVWAGTRSGLMRWDKTGKSWKVYTPAQGLSNITVISLANDGNYLWVGTAWGLNRMDKINETFQHYTTNDGLVDNQVRSIAIDGNFVWIGSLSGVSRFNKVEGTWQTFSKDNGLADNRVRAIVVEESYVWFATQGGVSRFEKETSSWETFTVSEGLVSNDVYSIGLDGTYVWFGTYDGLSRFDRIDNSWKTFTTQDGLASNFVRIIVVDGYEIWFIAGEMS